MKFRSIDQEYGDIVKTVSGNVVYHPSFGAREVSRMRAAARRRPLRHRLAVVAADPVEALMLSGGWVFDQSLAGWDVSVHVLEGGDPRPWQILGADIYNLRCSLDRRDADPWPEALAISATLLDSDAGIRDEAVSAIESGRCEMRILGATEMAGLPSRLAPDQHHLSLAAQAFKRRAVEAAHMQADMVGATEGFLSSTPMPLAAAAELISLSC
ncbi:hypothetical protein AAFP30_23345 [Gordonia sp. CPCC 205515]